jgi:putative inorganic carbon (hco3(-)) transporter
MEWRYSLDKMRSSALATRIIAGWLALGLIVQASFVLLPIGNYSTLVYWLFYVPLLLLLIWQYNILVSIIKWADRPLVIVFLALLLWVAVTSLWSDAEGGQTNTLLKSTRHNLLILFYVTGVTFLAYQFPRTLKTALFVSTAIVALAALISIIDQYLLSSTPVSTRLSQIGLGDWKDSSNQVVLGIYFGVYAVISWALLIESGSQSNSGKTVLALCTTACLGVVVLSGTRTALVAIFFTGVFSLLLQRKLGTVTTIGAIGTVVLTHGILDESAYLHSYLARDGFSWRPEIWLASLRASFDHFLVGTGMWHDSQLQVTRDGVSMPHPHSHNFYLQLLNWAGITGLSLYAGLLIRALILGYKNRGQPLAMAAFLSILYFVLAQVFDVYNVFTKPSYYWPCLWLPIGIILGLSGRITDTTTINTRRKRSAKTIGWPLVQIGQLPVYRSAILGKSRKSIACEK